METLLENEIVYANGTIITESVKLTEYLINYPDSKNMIIYNDTKNDILFSKAENSLNKIRDDFSFLDNKETWLDGIQGINRIQQQAKGLDEGGNRVWHSNGRVVKNPELVISTPATDILDVYNNRSCLIVGAGPSTKQVKWENIDVDYKIVMNQFYLNDDLLNTKFDIICPGGLVDFNDYRFKKYIIDNNPKIFLEPYFIKKNIQWFINKHINDMMFFVTRYCSKLGTAPRLIVLAILMGFKDIYYVGMDGYSIDMKAKHSFDNNDGAKDVKDYGLYRRQYTILYDYIFNDLLKIYPNVRLYNLGEGIKENMSTDITTKYMPLNGNIKKLIKI